MAKAALCGLFFFNKK